MTTLAYRDGVLAADSRCTRSGWIDPADHRKVHDLGGRLVGTTGDLALVTAFLAWAQTEDAPPPDMGDGARGVIVDKTGVRVFEGTAEMRWSGEYNAWGSGFPAALGALHAGATAEEAVRIACLLDPCSGGPVQSVRLDITNTKARRALCGSAKRVRATAGQVARGVPSSRPAAPIERTTRP